LIESPRVELIPIPYFGIDYPIIDGEGVSSMGREGTGTWKTTYIRDKMNEHDKINIYSMQSKLKEDQNYKLNKIVYDCVSSSPFYAVKDYYSSLNMIQHDWKPLPL